MASIRTYKAPDSDATMGASPGLMAGFSTAMAPAPSPRTVAMAAPRVKRTMPARKRIMNHADIAQHHAVLGAAHEKFVATDLSF